MAEEAYEHRHRKREAEEADNVEVAPGVAVASLRPFFIAALFEPTQGHVSTPQKQQQRTVQTKPMSESEITLPYK